MRKLFDPNAGIGLSFLRNPMGGSDLARFRLHLRRHACRATARTDFSIAHDLADVLPLTKRASSSTRR